MLKEESYIDYEVAGIDRFIHIKKITIITDDVTGEFKGKSIDRTTINPDDDTKAAKYGAEITGAANNAWTPEVRASWRAKVAARNL